MALATAADAAVGLDLAAGLDVAALAVAMLGVAPANAVATDPDLAASWIYNESDDTSAACSSAVLEAATAVRGARRSGEDG